MMKGGHGSTKLLHALTCHPSPSNSQQETTNSMSHVIVVALGPHAFPSGSCNNFVIQSTVFYMELSWLVVVKSVLQLLLHGSCCCGFLLTVARRWMTNIMYI